MLSSPSDLIADSPGLIDEILSSDRDVTSPIAAAGLFEEYFAARFRAAVTPSLRQVVLLSGGIDSIATLAALVGHLGPDKVEALTVVSSADSSDAEVASKVSSSLGVHHTFHVLSAIEAENFARHAVRLLQIDEMWEVSAAVVLIAAFSTALSKGPAQVWSGDGGDEILAGGIWPGKHPALGVLDGVGVDASSPTDFFAEVQRRTWSSEMTSSRLVPDFFSRVTPLTPLWRSMYTEEACRLAARLTADAVWGTSDKEPLRLLAERLGVPSHLTRNEKSPMQHSSGTLSVLLEASRNYVSRIPNSQQHRNTKEEPLEHNLIRLWLHSIANPGS